MLILFILYLILAVISFFNDNLVAGGLFIFFAILWLCFGFSTCKDKNESQLIIKTEQTIHYKYNLPEEISEIKKGQRLYCDSIVTHGNEKTVYLSFDNRAYYLEFSNTDGFIEMTDNNRLIHNFDSTSEIYKIMEADNE